MAASTFRIACGSAASKSPMYPVIVADQCLHLAREPSYARGLPRSLTSTMFLFLDISVLVLLLVVEVSTLRYHAELSEFREANSKYELRM